MAIDPMWQLEKNRNRRPNMKIRFAHLCSILALLTCASSASAQSANSQPVKTRGIDPALLTRAKAGDAEAELSLALSYCHLGDRKESCRWLRAAAENGDAMAQVAIAGSYESGPSVSDVPHTCACAVARDYAQAAIWYRKAAERGNALAQNGLGRLYADGKGVPQDYAEAFFDRGRAYESQGDTDFSKEDFTIANGNPTAAARSVIDPAMSDSVPNRNACTVFL